MMSRLPRRSITILAATCILALLNPLSLLAAPGVEILTTAPPHAYAFLSGTSLAAAHVSGVVALLLEREPRMSPGQLSSMTERRPAGSPTSKARR